MSSRQISAAERVAKCDRRYSGNMLVNEVACILALWLPEA
jgi:hypothetical protein